MNVLFVFQILANSLANSWFDIILFCLSLVSDQESVTASPEVLALEEFLSKNL